MYGSRPKQLKCSGDCQQQPNSNPARSNNTGNPQEGSIEDGFLLHTPHDLRSVSKTRSATNFHKFRQLRNLLCSLQKSPTDCSNTAVRVQTTLPGDAVMTMGWSERTNTQKPTLSQVADNVQFRVPPFNWLQISSSRQHLLQFRSIKRTTDT